METKLLNLQEVAEKLNMSTRTVRRYADRRLLPKARSIGRLVRWVEAELDEWIEAGCPPLKEC